MGALPTNASLRDVARRALLTFVVSALASSCKQVEHAPASSPEAAPASRLITWTVAVNGAKETLYLGLRQPGGGIMYLPKGVTRLHDVVRDVLKAAPVPSDFLHRLEQDAALVGRPTEQVGLHLLPEDLIPPALWLKGVRFEFFAFDIPAYRPDTIEALYARLAPAARERYRKSFPMVALDPMTFKAIMVQYREVYDLAVFQLLREQAKLDAVYAEAASFLYRAEQLAELEATLLSAGPIGALWKGLIGGASKRAAVGRFLGVTATYVWPRAMVVAQYRASVLGDEGYQHELNERRARALIGFRGDQALAENEGAYRALVAQTQLLPSFAHFLGEAWIRNALLEPTQFYELSRTTAALGQVDRAAIGGDVAAREAMLRRLVDRASGEGSKQNTEALLRLGMRSPLFVEALALALVKEPELTIDVWVDPTTTPATKHGTDGKIVIVPADLAQRATTTVGQAQLSQLSHELWHAAVRHWIFQELMSFSNEDQFYRAIATDETIAILLAVAVRDEIQADRQGFLEGMGSIIESVDLRSQETQARLLGADAMRDGGVFDAVRKNHARVWHEWRD